ncbi:hypothetical protein IF1G_05971 [Cordyceps javanica]|uniref:Uncharacterized protein n=1 Tax=Cordyceps javanica TaxID=43265 RepID=A0A545UZT4_9HYPO|nr:hypothetical protein IF1G_05971 [Cordyceps javanica]TQW05806.1 hypothetical protein IF2G_06928 [Cordyceps javanica]
MRWSTGSSNIAPQARFLSRRPYLLGNDESKQQCLRGRGFQEKGGLFATTGRREDLSKGGKLSMVRTGRYVRNAKKYAQGAEQVSSSEEQDGHEKELAQPIKKRAHSNRPARPGPSNPLGFVAGRVLGRSGCMTGERRVYVENADEAAQRRRARQAGEQTTDRRWC